MNTQRFLVIILWRRAQRYARPNPPWIALYTSLLDHPAWLGLDDAARSLLVSLWLYAARTGVDGRVWGDPEYLRSVLPVNGPVDLKPLLEARDGEGKPFPFVRWENDPPCARELTKAKRRGKKAAGKAGKSAPARSAKSRPVKTAAERGKGGRGIEGEAQSQSQPETETETEIYALDHPAEAEECARKILSGGEPQPQPQPQPHPRRQNKRPLMKLMFLN